MKTFSEELRAALISVTKNKSGVPEKVNLDGTLKKRKSIKRKVKAKQ